MNYLNNLSIINIIYVINIINVIIINHWNEVWIINIKRYISNDIPINHNEYIFYEYSYYIMSNYFFFSSNLN